MSQTAMESPAAVDLADLADRANDDAWLVHRGRFLTVSFLLEVGDQPWLVHVHRGRIERIDRGPFVMPQWTFALRADADAWSLFWQPLPPPGFHDLLAMVKSRRLRIEGDQQPFMANLLWFKELLALLRPARVQERQIDAPSVPEFEPAIGRYLRLQLLGEPQRLYVEEAGQGIPLVCLHTAGADGRQYRALLNHAPTLEKFRVIVFDMPAHGKSSPPAGWHRHEYRLSSADYVEMILTVCDALQLERPVVMGCSIGGRIVLHLALEHPERFRALIGLQSGAHVDPYYNLDWLHRPDAHGGEVCAGIVSGLVGPSAPEAERWETLWHYMQGGPGIFKGDLYFYKIDGDVRDRVAAIDTSRCPLYLLSGEYDYSCTPDDTRALADLIPGLSATIMPGLGHFPMSEDPERFLQYLVPVLSDIAQARDLP